MKRIYFHLLLLAGIIIVLTGVLIRIEAKTTLSALLIISGIILETTAIIFLLRKAITRNPGK